MLDSSRRPAPYRAMNWLRYAFNVFSVTNCCFIHVDYVLCIACCKIESPSLNHPNVKDVRPIGVLGVHLFTNATQNVSVPFTSKDFVQLLRSIQLVGIHSFLRHLIRGRHSRTSLPKNYRLDERYGLTLSIHRANSLDQAGPLKKYHYKNSYWSSSVKGGLNDY